MKTSTFSLLFIFIVQFTFAQVGSSCGFPDWDSAKGYPANSYIEYEGSVYLNSLWSQNEAPGLSENSNWVLLGVCNEQVIIDTPMLFLLVDESEGYESACLYVIANVYNITMQ